MIGNLVVTAWKVITQKRIFLRKKRNFKQCLWYSFAFNRAELNVLFSNICQFSLENVGLGSYDGSKYLNYSSFYKKYKALFSYFDQL
jgi:hypothetical protein